MISDELLKEALMLSMEEMIAFHKRAGEENPHRFSLAYKIRKRSIIRLAKRYETEKTNMEGYETEKSHARRHFMPLKRLALFMAIIAAAVILSVGAYAAYLIINGFVFDVHEEYSDVTLDLSEYELKDTIAEFYWFPPESGCESISEMVNSKLAISDYRLNENTFVLMQYTKSVAEQSMGANTENADISGVKINGNDGFIITRNIKSTDDNEIVWIMNGYVFYISSVTIAEDDLIKLAELITIKENLE